MAAAFSAMEPSSVKMYHTSTTGILNRRKILKKDELNVMYELSHFNSYIDKNMQVQNLELSIERLKRINENVAMDIAPRMKICRIGGITAGVFIAIMLI